MFLLLSGSKIDLMTSLDHQLHRLFLDHDCVVVPGLGGFVCNRQPARYDETLQELIPPSRGILFNERLTHHDGVLVQTLAQSEGITMDAALGRLHEETEQIKGAIASGKTVTIAHVGRLFQGSNGRIQFLADEEMEKMLRSFGLRRIPLRPLVSEASASEPLVSSDSGSSPRPGRIVPMSSEPLPLARIAAAIAVPILGGMGMFLMDGWNGQDALMSPLPVTPRTALYEPRFEGEAVPTWSDIVEMSAAETAWTARTAVGTPAITSEHAAGAPTTPADASLYMLVAGAFSLEDNAKALADQLVNQGFDAEIFLQDGGLHIVTFATHIDELSARAHLEVLRMQSVSSSAWLKPWKVIR